MGVYSADGHINVFVVDGLSITGWYHATGAWNVVDVTNVVGITGLYNKCGALNVTLVDGTELCGRYAANGSINVVNDSTHLGSNHPSGALSINILSGASDLLFGNHRGLSIDFTDDSFYEQTGFYGSATVKDIFETGDLVSTSSNFLTYTSPSLKLTMGEDGTLRYQAHNLRLQSNSIATTWAVTTGGVGVSPTRTDNHAVGPTGTTNASRLQLSLGGGTTSADISGVQQTITAAAGATYAHSVWLRSTDGTSSYVLQIQGAAGDVSNITVTGTWTRFEIESVASGNFSAAIRLRGAQTPTHSATADILVWGDHVRRTPSDSTLLETTTAARYALPEEWNTSGEHQGILVEAARTNTILQSNDCATTWTTTNMLAFGSGSVSNSTGTLDPVGLNTADLLVPTTGNNAKALNQPYTATATSWTLSQYVKPAGYTKFGFREGTVTGAYATFDLTGAGTVIEVNLATATIQALSNGWYRVSMTYTGTAAVHGWRSYVMDSGYASGAPSSYNYVGDGTSGMYLWGAQAEAGAFATSPIETFASTVTRAADNISLATTAFPFSATAGSVYASVGTGNNTSGVDAILEISDGTTNERLMVIYHTSATTVGIHAADGGVAQVGPSSLGTISGAAYKVAAAYAANDYAGTLNGGAMITDASATLATATKINIASNGTGTGAPNRYIKQIMYFSRRMTNAELQTLATNGPISGNMLNGAAGLGIDFTLGTYERYFGITNYNTSPTTTSSSLLTYTSPSAKLVMGPSGTLRYSAMNLQPASEDFDNATYWTASRATAVDQGNGEFLIREDATAANTHRIFSAATITGAGGPHTFTSECKAGGRTWVSLGINNPAGTRIEVLFQLSGSGAVGTTGVNASGTITALSDGWYRCSMSLTKTNTSTLQPYIGIAEADNDQIFDGDGASGIYVRKAHFRRTPSDSTYLATTTAARYALPLEWTSAGVLEGLLVEEARTNLCIYSSMPSNWTGINATVAFNNSVGPTGATEMMRLTLTGGDVGHRVSSDALTVVASTTYTASCYVKAGTLTTGTFYVRAPNESDTGFGGVDFDLDAETATAFAGATAATITSIGSGIYRVTATGQSSATSVACFCAAQQPGSSVNNDGGTLFFWGAQLELGAFPTSYIHVPGASTVTRAADNISLSASAFPYQLKPCTVFAQTKRPQTAIGASDRIWDFGSTLYATWSSTQLQVVGGSTGAVNITATSTNVVKAGVVFDTNDLAVSVDGAAVVSDTSTGTDPSVGTSFAFGNRPAGARELNGYLQKIMFLPRRMTNTELQTLTT